jgi:hypothetical protein
MGEVRKGGEGPHWTVVPSKKKEEEEEVAWLVITLCYTLVCVHQGFGGE